MAIDRSLYKFGLPIYTGAHPAADTTQPPYNVWIRSDIDDTLFYYDASDVLHEIGGGGGTSTHTLLFSYIAPFTVTDIITNTTTETEFATKYTFPADSMETGDNIRFTVHGNSSTTLSPGTIYIKVYLGGEFLLGWLNVSPGANQDEEAWRLEADWGFQYDPTATDVGYYIRPYGQMQESILVHFTHYDQTFGGGYVEIDPTIDNDLTITVTYSTANAQNIIDLRLFTVERMRL